MSLTRVEGAAILTQPAIVGGKYSNTLTSVNGPIVAHFHGTTISDIAGQLADAAIHLNSSTLTQPFDAAARLHCAVVVSDVTKLSARLQWAADRIQHRSQHSALRRRGVFVVDRNVRRRLGWLFPGQNGPYVGVLKDLIVSSTVASDALAEADRLLVAEGELCFADLAWQVAAPPERDLWHSQMVGLIVAYVYDRALRAAHVPCDFVLGFSSGEIPALLTAGVWDLSQAFRACRARHAAIVAMPADGIMAATTAPATVVRDLLATGMAGAYLATEVSSKLNVVSGSEDAVHHCLAALAKRGFAGLLLPLRCPFHTPLLEKAAADFAVRLDSIAMRPPRSAIYSLGLDRWISTPADLRYSLHHQLCQPLRLGSTIRKLAAEHANVWLEMGPQASLTTALADDPNLLEELFLAVDGSQCSAVESWCRVHAAIECLELHSDQTSSISAPSIMCGALAARNRCSESDTIQEASPSREPLSRGGGKMSGQTPATPFQTLKHSRGASLGADSHRDVLPGSPRSNPRLQSTLPDELRKTRNTAFDTQEIMNKATNGSRHIESLQIESAETAHENAMESFLINYVVESTGYPPDMIDLDADLEADLGIDSIKKAQLFGEIGEHFKISADATLSLDNFPTLRHVLDYIYQVCRPATQNEKSSAPDRSNYVKEPQATFDSDENDFIAVEEPAEMTARRSTTSAADTPKRTLPNLDRWVTQRFVFQVVAAPLSNTETAELLLVGPVLIVGRNPCADALSNWLTERGCEVTQWPPLRDERKISGRTRLQTESTTAQILDSASCSQAIDAFEDERFPLHLFLMTACDKEAELILEDEAAWQRRREAGLFAPFAIIQAWYRRLLSLDRQSQTTLAAMTMMGGDLGFNGESGFVEGGGITGLMKALRNETPGAMHFKVLDVAPEAEPDDAIAALVRELAAEQDDLEVGWRAGERWVVQATPLNAAELPSSEVEPHGCWVVTGGARGITALVARALAERWSLDLHILGSSPLPDIEPAWRSMSGPQLKQLKAEVAQQARKQRRSPQAAWTEIENAIEMDRTLRDYASAGIAIRYHRCDVSDRRSLATTLTKIRRTSGPIEGVLHGAGFESAGKFSGKSLETVERVIGAKVDGTLGLIELTADDPLRHFLAFTSTSGRFGGVGQTDYSLANDLVAKLIARLGRLRPECRAIAFDWGPWAGVGMASRAESRFALQAMNLAFMPSEEGVCHVIRELSVDSPNAEVMATQYPGSPLDSHPTMPGSRRAASASSLISPDGPVVNNNSLAKPPFPSSIQPSGQVAGAIDSSVLQQLVWKQNGDQSQTQVEYSAVSHPFANEYRVAGSPALATSSVLELLAAGAVHALGANRLPLRASNLHFAPPLRFISPASRALAIEVKSHSDLVEASVVDTADQRASSNLATATWHASGTLFKAIEMPSHPPFGWSQVYYSDQWPVVYYGQRLQSLKHLAFQHQGGWGKVVSAMPPLIDAGLSSACLLPVELFEAGFMLCGLFYHFMLSAGVPVLPRTCRHMQLFRLPLAGEESLLRFKCHPQADGQYYFDFTLQGADGTPILEIHGYQVYALGDVTWRAG